MEPKPIALSVLMTREEYMQLTVQIHRLRSGGPSFLPWRAVFWGSCPWPVSSLAIIFRCPLLQRDVCWCSACF